MGSNLAMRADDEGFSYSDGSVVAGCRWLRTTNYAGKCEVSNAAATPAESLTSPTVDSPMASSGTTLEPLDAAVIADEQLSKTVNSNADAAWGDWAVDSATVNGEPLPNEVAATISLYIDEGSYVVNLGDQVDKGTVVIRRDTDPMELDITGIEGPNAEKTILAIFDQDDSNSLIVCYAFDGAVRPKEFTSTAENGHFLVKYKRKVVK